MTYYREALGLDLAWKAHDGQLAAIATGGIEILLLVPWTGGEPPAPQSFYVYVEDPDALCADAQRAGANVVDTVALRRSVENPSIGS